MKNNNDSLRRSISYIISYISVCHTLYDHFHPQSTVFSVGLHAEQLVNNRGDLWHTAYFLSVFYSANSVPVRPV